jgi:uncharacterized protein with PIN domain
MIVDTSAVIAILRDEPEAEACARAIERSAVRCISAANFLEAALIIDASHDPIASRRFDDFMKEAQIVVEPVTVKPRLELRERPIATSGRAAATPRDSISAIALPTR